MLSTGESNALKKYAVKYRAVTVRANGKRIDIPVEAAILQSDEKGLFTFVSIPAFNGIFGLTSNGVEPIKPDEKNNAVQALKKAGRAGTTKRGGKGAVAVELPPEVLEALKKLPKGLRLVAENGEYKVQRTRAKRTAKA